MPLQYWDDIITQQSWNELQTFNKKYNFVLIGGWAVYLYSKTLKSKDIDVAVNFDTLAQFKKDFNVRKNERLKKYEIKERNFDIDIYVEHYSNPGLPAEAILENAVGKDGFTVPVKEMLLILKQETLKKRQGSIKGEKDKIDIISLLQEPIDSAEYEKLASLYNRKNLKDELIHLLNRTVEVKELGLNKQKMAQLKRRVYKDLDT